MPFNVQFEDEHFLDIHERPEQVESPLVRFLIRHHIFKNKKIAYIVLITLIVIMFGIALGFFISAEIKIQNNQLQNQLQNSKPVPVTSSASPT